ncbi:HIRA-interacting protein 3 isoform X1 [Poeciliopsis prolifica]|uniref:HIRA-interacting protein 3 isoform X1 n=1 Tax=Poeciliopsis prolifica TaxID=188132 RepID=UPI002413276F|nr:HIRA-interacting protein 3 isoform X1 [Poeciliopsis prolifica]
MASEKEKTNIRRFIEGQLLDEPDLCTLTLGILKKRYLAEAGCESLSSEAKQFMKQVVQEELMKMQENDESEIEPETKKTQKKRKREREKEKLESEDETESTPKKSRSQQSDSSSDSEDAQNREAGSQNKEQIRSQSKNKEAAKESDHEKSKKAKRRVTSDESSDEEINESEEDGNESPSPEKKVKKKVNAAERKEARRIDASGGKKAPRSDEESESDSDNKLEKSEKIEDDDSSASEKVEENAKDKNDSDSDSSSLPSLDEDKKSNPVKNTNVKTKKKTKKTDEKNCCPKDEDKAVVRLKRYIALCGVRRNYKKLLDGCRSTRSKVAVLKKELEDLGLRGNPSIEKCKKIRLKREEAQELAELDVDNIISTEAGRPRRRGTSAMQVHKEPPSSYQRTLNSDSDSDQENNAPKGRRKISEWANLHGIISDDADTE